MSTENLHADVVIVGSGVCGALIGAQLAKAGKSVLILEAGPRVKRRDIVETYRDAPVKLSLANMKLQGAGSPFPSLPHAPSTYGDYLEQKGPVKYNTSYLRVVGGTTWHFGSALWRLLPSEFKLNSLYGRGRDWPIGYDDLEKYYGLAEMELGVSGTDDQDESGAGGSPSPARAAPYPMKQVPLTYMFRTLAEKLSAGGYNPVWEPHGRATRPYNQRPVCAGNNNCNPVCPIGAKYDGSMHCDIAENRGAVIMPNAVVYKLEDDDTGRIQALWFKRPDGSEHKVTAKVFVVAAHTIETPKLLLMSKTRHSPNGIANSSDMVGRNLMDTTGISVTMKTRDPVWPGQGPTELLVFNKREGDFRRNAAQYKIKVRNTTPVSQYAATLLEQGVLGTELDRRIQELSAHTLAWAVDFEVLPDPANRVTLSKTKFDALGLPVPSLYYDLNDYWHAGTELAMQDLNRFSQLLDAEITKKNMKFENRQHPSGTTIMGDNPRDSVVNRDCRAHDHPNLYIAGTSVMSASTCMNPTLTAAALSIRIAERIQREI
ncbi:GMC family oxidoreductase [Gluconobacter sphaericus]|uniref:Choline dehydrogenase n=1 Tax=Gluconobacter sphaericus NBRC 12467 TaxID=1307951 RepID=A0AA37WBM0_9PROT|nr:GMC family oxidoreductase [Gluconobacter sphaericus]MBF0885203.1 GMC family oxidoreductase [Gluconobacter sphaericus]QQX91221.1 GMC family oxidoreductase [Gluconobacter sphaericus]GBR55852.1 FAD dependent oxidoreductase [Gluconobacter sphaericus NBRC 12467]GEB43128.1 choline dehydrogenase [Gluconobacter sphaericus NBRC 12467]GLQ84411.1 choline dehydrogenase [Gluconobacter sphaericus NBRC 12467]